MRDFNKLFFGHRDDDERFDEIREKEEAQREAQADGYNKGCDDGFDEGFDKGFDSGYDSGFEIAKKKAADKEYRESRADLIWLGIGTVGVAVVAYILGKNKRGH